MNTNRSYTFFLGLAVSLLAPLALCASPASGRRLVCQKENGESVSVVLRGDEYGHWYEDEAGNTYTLSPARRLSRIAKPAVLSLRRAAMARRNTGQLVSSSGYQPGSLATETVFTVVFAAFSDLPFQEGSVDFFKAFLGEGNPSALNTAWSTIPEGENAFTYWGDLLDGKRFKVFPEIITLSRGYAYYGSNEVSNDRYATSIRTELITKMNRIQSGYSSSSNIIIIFSGQGEAESGDPDRVWPCCYGFGWKPSGGNTVYTCELSSSNRPAIGTLMHEFGHAMGLPDLYDVDYEENGYATLLPDKASVMCSGNFNGDGMCPPSISAVERMILLGEEEMLSRGQLVQLKTDQTNTLLPVSEGVLYYTYNPKRPEEWFIAEYRPRESRGKKTWDYECTTRMSYDMLYYHLDRRSDYTLPGDFLTARQRFICLNRINAREEHPLFSRVHQNQILSGNIDLWPDSKGNTLLLGYSILSVKTDSYAASADVTVIGRPESGKANIVIVVKSVGGILVDPSTIHTNAPGTDNINGVYYVSPYLGSSGLSGKYVFWRDDLQCAEVSVKGTMGTCQYYSVSLSRKPLYYPLYMTWTQTYSGKALSIGGEGKAAGVLYATMYAAGGSFGCRAAGLSFDTAFFPDESLARVSVVCCDAEGRRMALCADAPVTGGKVTFTSPAVLPGECRLLLCITCRDGSTLTMENFLTGPFIAANKHEMRIFSQGEVQKCDLTAQIPVSLLLEKAEDGDVTASSLNLF